jgi:hypothetical protein
MVAYAAEPIVIEFCFLSSIEETFIAKCMSYDDTTEYAQIYMLEGTLKGSYMSLHVSGLIVEKYTYKSKAQALKPGAHYQKLFWKLVNAKRSCEKVLRLPSPKVKPKIMFFSNTDPVPVL